MTPFRWETPRTRLRALRPDDWEHFVRWNRDPDWSNADLFAYPPLSEEHSRRWLESELAKPPSDDRRFIIEDATSGYPVGTIDIVFARPQAGTFGYGIAIGSDSRRAGHATDAIVLVLGYYFLERRYQKVTTSVWSFNAASMGLHEKLGFVQEGRVRRAVYRDGQHHDELFYGMTVEEFVARYGSGVA